MCTANCVQVEEEALHVTHGVKMMVAREESSQLLHYDDENCTDIENIETTSLLFLESCVFRDILQKVKVNWVRAAIRNVYRCSSCVEKNGRDKHRNGPVASEIYS